MDFLSTKVIYIAVGLFITIVITTSIVFTISKVSQIYGQVNKTDIDIKSGIAEFAMYDNTTLYGIDLVNTVKKYKVDNNVVINIKLKNGALSSINKVTWLSDNENGSNVFGTYLYKAKYNTTVIKNQSSQTVTITYTEE